MAKLPLVFFGTGPVAAKSLEALGEIFDIELVFTKPKKQHHKYRAPVEELSKSKSYKICFANSSQEIKNQLELLGPVSEVGIVIDFGLIVSSNVISYFEHGIINSHFSLLPRWRGPDPITYAILNGDKTTGVSLMKIVEQLDKGPLIAQKNLSIDKKDNQITLTEKLIALSNNLLVEYLPEYIEGKLKLKPQSEKFASYSKKTSKKDGKINWSKPAEQIEREIRAYAGWPKSRTNINDVDCIILDADANEPADHTKSGEIYVNKDALLIGCGVGTLAINTMQPAGKKPMSASEFIRGYLKNNLGS